MRRAVLSAPVTLVMLALLPAASARAVDRPAAQPAAPEIHLADIRRLTTGGENAEGYFSFDGSRLVFQRTAPEGGCDQIYELPLAPGGKAERVSSGLGRTTCGFFFPDGRLLYSTTAFGSPQCPPPPDRKRGYLWGIYPDYEIVVQDAAPPAAGSAPRRLTDNHAYDAEATVCGKDGSIVFTSDRDGDLELYRMKADGSDVVRLTHAVGYDGGAVWSPDCSLIAWRASRPHGAELQRYEELLHDHLVEPGRLELWVANADGTQARQITYLDAASFGPAFYPSGDRIVFSSNIGRPDSPEFDLWGIDVQGTRLERLTTTPSFDGFPMFSPDGKQLVFATNRFPGKPHETDLVLARWVDAPPVYEPRGPDRFLANVAWLADDARQGRRVGTPGGAAAADWLEKRFRELGLEPGFPTGYRQRLEVPVGVRALDGTSVAIDGRELARGTDFEVTGFSAAGAASAAVVPAGYGIVDPGLGRDDFAGVDVQGKIALVRRFVPAGDAFAEPAAAQRYGDLRYKAFNARQHGAIALLVVDAPEGKEVEEAPLPKLRVEQRGDAGIPVVVLTRRAGAPLLAGAHHADLKLVLAWDRAPVDNVVGVLRAHGAPQRTGAIVVGAHYDHLGTGGPESLAPESTAVHPGADDNASGVAAVLETAHLLGAQKLQRDVWFVAFTGEEEGLYGSTELVRRPPPTLDVAQAMAMINFDMVGRLRDDKLTVLGGDSAKEWRGIFAPLCARIGFECTESGDGYGPSDQTPFYAAGVPVAHLFTGVHDDYHKPSDTAATINAAGGARIAEMAAQLVADLAAREARLTYQQVAAPPPPAGADVRSYGAGLGTVPDYTGPPEGQTGVLLAGTRPGGPAEKAGMKRGDILVELAGTPIRDVNDFMYVLRAAKPGQTSTAVVVRDGQRVTLTVTFDQARRR